MTTYRVTAERTPTGWWALEVPEVGAVSQVRRIDQIEDEMREAVAYLAGVDESEVQFEIDPVLSPELQARAAEVRSLHAAAEEASARAAAASREVARSLRAQGLSVRDVGTVMDVSPQRVSQLTSARSAG